MFRLFYFICCFLLYSGGLCAQSVSDSLPIDENKSESVFSVLFKGKPGKALAYSLLLPGAGQVYNGKIWKVPILYAGFGTLIYFVNFNSKYFNRYDKAYHMRVDSIPGDEFEGILSLQGINSYRQFYDKNLQLSYIGIGILYLLNGIEAFVDRHLQEFDISKNLSINYKADPMTQSGQISFIYTLR